MVRGQRTMSPIILSALSVILSAGATGQSVQTPVTQNLVQTIGSRPAFSTFYNLVSQTSLAHDLATSGPDGRGYTVFVPTDDAFAKMPPQVLAAMKSDPSLLREVLEYAVVPVTQRTIDLDTGMNRITLEGEGLELATDTSGATIAMTPLGLSSPIPPATEATVTSPDLEASNGVIQGINHVLLPPTVYQRFNLRDQLMWN